MSSSNQPNESQAGKAGGLQGSPPLVTLASGPPKVNSASSVPVQKLTLSPGGNLGEAPHPLAVPYALKWQPPVDVELSEKRRPTLAPVMPAAGTPSSFPVTTPQRTSPPKQAAKSAPEGKASMDVQVDEFLSGPSARLDQGGAPLLRAVTIPDDKPPLERLRAHVERRQWALVASQSEGLLRGSTSHYQPLYASLLRDDHKTALPVLESQQQELVEILLLYCQSLVLLKRNVELGVEVEQWSFLHEEPPIEWIPWSLHVMAAESLMYTNSDAERPKEALWALRQRILNDQNDYRRAVGLAHVEGALGNLAIRMKDWRMALKAQQRLIEDVLPQLAREAAAKDPSSHSIETLTTAYKCELLSRQGRILLQAGALPAARETFEKSRSLAQTIEVTAESPQVVQILPAQVALDEGLLSFGYGKYEEALEFFRKAVQSMVPQRKWTLDVDASEKSLWSCLSISTVDLLVSEAVNNMALCALYTCRLPEALQLLEGLIRQDPATVMTDRVVSNICTLYELGFDSAVAASKKRVLLHVAHNRFGLYDIGVEHFRLS